MSDITSLCGDNRDVLKTLPAKSFQACITSPPYYGLRQYGGGDREIGQEKQMDCLAWATGAPRCDACFICSLLSVFGGKAGNDGVWRVLRDDGVLWVNIGDSYSQGGNGPGSQHYQENCAGAGTAAARNLPPKRVPGLAPKNLCLVPQRFALAMQAAGWTVAHMEACGGSLALYPSDLPALTSMDFYPATALCAACLLMRVPPVPGPWHEDHTDPRGQMWGQS